MVGCFMITASWPLTFRRSRGKSPSRIQDFSRDIPLFLGPLSTFPIQRFLLDLTIIEVVDWKITTLLLKK